MLEKGFLRQERRGEIGAAEVAVFELRACKIRAAEIGAGEIAIRQIGVLQIGEAQIGAREIGAAQDSALKVRGSQHAAHEAHRLVAHVGARIGARELRTGKART